VQPIIELQRTTRLGQPPEQCMSKLASSSARWSWSLTTLEQFEDQEVRKKYYAAAARNYGAWLYGDRSGSMRLR
jgi:hypothetical protein